MSRSKLREEKVKFVVCGRFKEQDDRTLQGDIETEEIITTLIDALKRKELYPYTEVGFCNCGNAEEHGVSITVLPEKVRYMDVDEESINAAIERHVEAPLREMVRD